MSLAIVLHLIAVVVWVGGMFFAHMALRPVAASLLEPPLRLPLMAGVLGRFFPWVWISVLSILATGFWMILGPLGGFKAVYLGVHLMTLLGLVMAAVFFYIYFLPFPRLKRAVAGQNWPEAGKALARIRGLIGFNLVLGLVTTLIGAGGKYLLQ